jgi:bacillithiol biosynthesis cysteine-adding enzyme BshC
METDCIRYQDSGYFNSLIVDYLSEKETVQPLYNRFPKLEHFKAQIEEKKQFYTAELRSDLVNVLLTQNVAFTNNKKTEDAILSLKKETTFTVTTGHQLNLFTGPMYFLYKIVSTINLCKELKQQYPDCNFVPVYWMATEDHDFEEINHFVVKNQKITWNKDTSGPVGRLDTNGLAEVFKEFKTILGLGENAAFLENLFKKAYLEHDTLTAATRFLAYALFKNEDLVIVDGDDAVLKKNFAPYIKHELVENTTYISVTKTIEQLQNYVVQVNPREINLFYIKDNLRERIVFENNVYSVNNTGITFTKDEILEEVTTHPENFSPNVLMRPLYQEIILPNLCYIGGGGEIAYWLQLKASFESFKVPFPILLLRNSVLLSTEKLEDKRKKLQLLWSDLFKKQPQLINDKVKSFSAFNLNFSVQKTHLQEQFKAMYEMARKTDSSFEKAVKAQEIKQIKGLDNLEKRLLKAEKKIHTDKLERIVALQNQLFPNKGLQERTINFSEFYLEYGEALIPRLLKELKPLEHHFTIITF